MSCTLTTNRNIEDLINDATQNIDGIVAVTAEIISAVQSIANKSGVLNKEDEKTLILISQKTGGYGTDVMYTKQLPSVEKICKSFAAHHKSQQDIEDYIHDCYFSVEEAMQNYNLSTSTRFNTFMTIYIIKDLNETWYKGNPCSKYYQQQNHLICDFCDEFEKTFGRAPTECEIANALNYTPDRVATIRREALKCAPIYFEEVTTANDEDSLYDGCTRAADAIFMDSALRQESPEDKHLRYELRTTINQFLQDIGPERADVLCRYIGIGKYHQPQSKAQIIRETGMSKQFVNKTLQFVMDYGQKIFADYR